MSNTDWQRLNTTLRLTLRPDPPKTKQCKLESAQELFHFRGQVHQIMADDLVNGDILVVASQAEKYGPVNQPSTIPDTIILKYLTGGSLGKPKNGGFITMIMVTG